MHPDHAWIADIFFELHARGGELAVGFVEHQHAVLGQSGDELRDRAGVVPGSHRVVGVRQVHQRRARLAHPVHERFEIDVIVAVGHRVQLPAESRDLVVEGRIGAERGHHGHAGLYEHPHRQSEQLVDTTGDADVVDPHSATCRDLRAQLEGFRITVPRHLRDRLAHRLRGARRYPERALVGADPHLEPCSPATLDRLRTHEGNRRRQSGHDGSEGNPMRHLYVIRNQGRRIVARRSSDRGAALGSGASSSPRPTVLRDVVDCSTRRG